MGFLVTLKENLKAASENAKAASVLPGAGSPSFRLGGRVAVKNSEIVHRRDRYPLAGAHATVDIAGEIDRRVTATRLVLAGPLALGLRKKKDTRQLFLLVQGPGWGFVEEVDPRLQREAREFAVKLNSAAHQTAASGPRTLPPRLPWSTIMHELEHLGRERSAGKITDSDYLAAKAKLLES